MDRGKSNTTVVADMDDYNAAISDTSQVVDQLDILAIGWGAIALFKLFGL